MPYSGLALSPPPEGDRGLRVPRHRRRPGGPGQGGEAGECRRPRDRARPHACRQPRAGARRAHARRGAVLHKLRRHAQVHGGREVRRDECRRARRLPAAVRRGRVLALSPGHDEQPVLREQPRRDSRPARPHDESRAGGRERGPPRRLLLRLPDGRPRRHARQPHRCDGSRVRRADPRSAAQPGRPPERPLPPLRAALPAGDVRHLHVDRERAVSGPRLPRRPRRVAALPEERQRRAEGRHHGALAGHVHDDAPDA